MILSPLACLVSLKFAKASKRSFKPLFFLVKEDSPSSRITKNSFFRRSANFGNV